MNLNPTQANPELAECPSGRGSVTTGELLYNSGAGGLRPEHMTLTSQPRRRLTVIMLTDVVGYSRMVERDEVATLAELKALREAVIDPLLARYHGRLVKLMGDGAMVEFASVVEAVSCAVAIQEGIADAQVDTADDRRIVLRIGINLGDVLVEGDDLLGDGVNVAARLEQSAAPGEILVSGTAHEHLKGKVNFALNPLGERTLKNISEPVRVFRVDSGGQPTPTRPQSARRPGWVAAAFGSLLALLLVPGAWWLWPARRSQTCSSGSPTGPCARRLRNPSRNR